MRIEIDWHRKVAARFLFRSGVLQGGDRVLAINGHLLEGMTMEDARSIIRRSNHQIHMEIEFDVTGMFC